jgi:DNA-3-methyladenine glycosylase II
MTKPRRAPAKPKKTPPVIARALTEAEFERARRMLMRRDVRLRPLIKRVGRCGMSASRGHDPFVGLVRVIMSQQLSGKAADTIFGRVEKVVGGRELLTPANLRAADATALRGAGVSRPKISYLYDLAERVQDGRLDLHALDGHPDEEVIAQITAVKGLGRWSAEMFLMFRLNRPDIFPVGDLGIVKGFQKLFGMKRRPSPRTMERLAESWRPYRSVAAWYLWRILE